MVPFFKRVTEMNDLKESIQPTQANSVCEKVSSTGVSRRFEDRNAMGCLFACFSGHLQSRDLDLLAASFGFGSLIRSFSFFGPRNIFASHMSFSTLIFLWGSKKNFFF